MPDARRHRGTHPADNSLFNSDTEPTLQLAVADLSWLLSKGYAPVSSLKLVGDRYELRDRQRTAVLRCACSDQSLNQRKQNCVPSKSLNGNKVAIDGFNLLTTIECVLGGGVLIRGRDGCLRDMASMHGTYRKVEETRPALLQIGRMLTSSGISSARWLLDRPVSNSGRLCSIIRDIAETEDWPWTAELCNDPDRVLTELSDSIVISADSWVIENSREWCNFAAELVATMTHVRVFL